MTDFDFDKYIKMTDEDLKYQRKEEYECDYIKLEFI